MIRLLFALVTLIACCGLGTDVGVPTTSQRLSAPPAESADASTSPAPAASELTASIGQPFELQLGQTVVVEERLEVTFAAVIADSRCPADVQCVWEGNAEIEIDVVVTDQAGISLRLNTNPGFPTKATYLAYSFELMALVPYPRTDSVDDQPYRATLTTERVSGVPASPSPSPSSSPSPRAGSALSTSGHGCTRT